MNKNILLEIGTEEIPARFMSAIIADLKSKTAGKLKEYRLAAQNIDAFGTPRRLVLFIEKISPKQETIKKEVKGPPLSAGQVAANGFAKSQGVKIEDLESKKIENGQYYFANVSIKGKKTEDCIAEILTGTIKSLYLPISMLWGKGNFKFIRPIHWILALYGNKIINFDLAEVKSGDFTFGHRFESPQNIKIPEADLAKFKNTLSENFVIIDQGLRSNAIKTGASSAAKKAKGKLWLDNSLLEEVTFLTEYPGSILGQFNKDFLELPKEVLITSMKKHQKYFPVLDSKDNLLPAFVITCNGKINENEKNIKEGNEKVLTARLSDAKFFYDEDIKVPLEQKLEQLKKTTLNDKLGSIYDKIQRIQNLASFISETLGLPDTEKEKIISIARLCKTDLATNMVYEFPELQGIMGREYALRQGIDPEIAEGIFEHYLPRTADDNLPESIPGIIVSLADKIDSIVGFFGIGLIPTGSEDPYALRRQCLGITKILLKNDINVSLEKIIDKSYNAFKSQPQIRDMSDNLIVLKSKITDFILQRLKGILLDEKIRSDFIDSVLSSNFYSIPDSYRRARLISESAKKEWFNDLFLTGDRISRLAANAKRKEIHEGEFICEQEREMCRIFKKSEKEVAAELESKNYEEAMIELSRLSKPVNSFFESVMVMVDNPDIRDNRLALLKAMDNMFKNIADFTKVAM